MAEAVPAAQLCAFCKTASHGCTPGRCFSPRSRMSDEKPMQPAPSRVAAPPLGPKRIVIAAHARSGANGGHIWILELECRHVVWRRGRKRTAAPKTETCFDCSEHPMAMCGCGCGKVGDLTVRMTQWVWYRQQWFAPEHALRAGISWREPEQPKAAE